jgi:hypothetical protein
MNDGETQEFRLEDLGPPQEIQSAYCPPQTPLILGLTERFADPALGATPRKVHSVRNADLARITWRLAIIVLVLCTVVLAGLIALEIALFDSIP